MLTGDTKCRPLPGIPPSAGLPAPNLASGVVNELPGAAGIRAIYCLLSACMSTHMCLHGSYEEPLQACTDGAILFCHQAACLAECLPLPRLLNLIVKVWHCMQSAWRSILPSCRLDASRMSHTQEPQMHKEPAKVVRRCAGQQTSLQILLSRCAKRSMLNVSVRLPAAGLTLAIMIVFKLPPSNSCSAQPQNEVKCTLCKGTLVSLKL